MPTQAFRWPAVAWIIVLFVLLLSAYPTTQAGAIADSQYWAVVVGISDYADDDQDVDCTARSATDIHDQLVSVWGEDQIKLLIDDKATKHNIRSAIVSWLASSADENDTLLFFFTGHGDDSDTNDYICAYDEDISDTELNEWMNSVPSSAQIVILDSCHSGGFIEDLSQKNRIVMTACDADQHACTLVSLGYSIFSFCILEALRNLGDANIINDGVISAEEIYSYAESQVPRYIGENQRPQFYDGYSGDLMMLYVPITNAEVVPDTTYNAGNPYNSRWFWVKLAVALVFAVSVSIYVIRLLLLKRSKAPNTN